MRIRAAVLWACAAALTCPSVRAGEGGLLIRHEEGTAAHLTVQGMTAHQQERFQAAIGFYRQALEVDGRYFPALYNLALAYQQNGRGEEASRRYLEALQARPDHPEVHCNLGVLAYEQGRYQEAVTRFSAAAAATRGSDRQAGAYHYNLGTAYEALGQWVEAQRTYLACLDLVPDHFGACYNLGTLHLGPLADAREAERYLRRAADIDPTRPAPLVNLAVLAERRQDGRAEELYDQAVTVARAATASRPGGLPRILWLRARFYDRLVPPKKVAMRRDLQEILELDASFPGANGMLGLHYEAIGQFDQAIPLLEREVDRTAFDESDEIDLECVYVLARLYDEYKRDKERALHYATTYYRLLPESAKAEELRRRSLHLPLETSEPSAPERPAEE